MPPHTGLMLGGTLQPPGMRLPVPLAGAGETSGRFVVTAELLVIKAKRFPREMYLFVKVRW